MVSHLKKVGIILFIGIYFAFGLTVISTYALEVDVRVMTEEFPPFNYQDKDTVGGLATTIVRRLLKEANLSYKIELVPWKRAYRTALDKPNTLIYTIAKTESRRDKFLWICKISNRRVSMFRLSSRKDLARMTFEEAKKTAKIAVIQGDASTEKIMTMGFDRKNFTLMPDTTSANLCMKHVMRGRSDFFLMNPYTLQHRVNSGEISDVFKEQFVIHDADGYYIAANPQTDPKILKALTAGSNRLEKNGFISKTVSDYLAF